MALSIAEGRNLLTAYGFITLFIEKLGWNRYKAKLEIHVDGWTFTLSAIAEKCGMVAFVCDPGADGRIPNYPTRRKIERQVAKSAHEHIIIFTDEKRSTQIWQWVRREQGKPAACREHPYHVGQPGDSLIQKIRALSVSLEEEEGLTLPDVTTRTRKAFDVERITKRFYDRFKTEHAAFLGFLDGIPAAEMNRWYVSVMLNRLMFVYFIQKKGFLGGGDTNYLKNKLSLCRTELGKDRYYRDLLCPLFFEGFAKKKEERSEKAGRLLGEVPYLNGGIFMPHQIEQLYGKTIAISDNAFEKLFEFFDAYHWHLDERPLKKDDEINPDVLGYIFEKYINQKQMGAYYTKEDITEYISKNTVVPFLFDAAREKCKVAFEGERSIWNLLKEDPDRYFYPAVSHGIVWDAHQIPPNRLDRAFELPSDIAVGLDTSKPDLIERRKLWNKPAPPEYSLPTEIWREVIARRKRYEEIRNKIITGEVHSINDLITYNLDIRQFAQDAIENSEGPELLLAFWKAIESVTVLDPACGSGAFLFAALNILDPLYEACLERMRFFLEEWGDGGKKNHPNYYKLFAGTLKRVEEHPNHRYFILKSIIINTLYGVDIMEEAVEICKLRLFLKLVAQIERVEDIEPLPDIDFNIRSGNTLVGFVTVDEVKRAAEKESYGQGKIIFEETAEAVRRIEDKAELADRAFQMFRMQQTDLGGLVTPRDKQELLNRVKILSGELDRYLASEYGISETKFADRKKHEEAFGKWQNSHQPFHWFAEFYGILKAGGFDVILGNPPYVEYRKIEKQYTVLNLKTVECGNLYAFIMERSFKILQESGRFGMIVPISIACSERMASLRQIIHKNSFCNWISHFAIRPQSLFAEIMQRNSIVLTQQGKTQYPWLYSTKYLRWCAAERYGLFTRLFFTRVAIVDAKNNIIPKIASNTGVHIIETIATTSNTRISCLAGHKNANLYFHDSGESYWTKTLWEKPTAFRNGVRVEPAQWFQIKMSNEHKPLIYLLLNSNLFYFLWTVYTDCRHMTKGFIESIPLPCNRQNYHPLVEKMRKAYRDNTVLFEKRIGYKSPEITVHNFKSLIDEVDGVLAKYYGFTDEQLDFIVNYDVKYRIDEEGCKEREE